MRNEERMVERRGKRTRNTAICHNMTGSHVPRAGTRVSVKEVVRYAGKDVEYVVGGWVGMNRWAMRREWCIGQERERKTQQYVTT
jgi:hypothetical protein